MRRRRRIEQLGEATSKALMALAVDVQQAYDGWLDRDGLRARLQRRDGELLLRAAPDAEADDGDYGPLPVDPLWLRLTAGEPGMTFVAVRGGEVREETAVGVTLRTTSEPCCDAPKCEREKVLAQLSLQTDGDTVLLLAESLCDDARDADQAMGPLRLALAQWLGLEDGGAEPAAVSAADERDDAATGEGENASGFAIHDLVNWSLRREGGRFVIRDFASHGPAEGALREWLLVAVIALGAAYGWWGVIAHGSGGEIGQLATYGAVGAVLSVAVFAFANVALHSSRYRATSEALLFVARDRLVIAPWHARTGAVDGKPEGRYGAALALREIQQLEVRPNDGGWTIHCTTDHGPFHVGWLGSEALAQRWCERVQELVDNHTHHGVGKRRSPKAKRARGAKAAALATLVMLAAAGLGCGPATGPAATAPAAPPAAASASLQLIEDDVPAALRAAADKQAVLVEVWAPWCHTCLSMKSFVLPDPAIVALQTNVVFAAVDSDRPANADFMDRHAVNVWPTLFMLDPQGEVIGLWQGAASVEELRDFIQSALDDREATLASDGPVAALRQAKRHHATSAFGAAASSYELALQRGGPSWRRRSEALAGLIFCAYRQQQWRRCAQLGVEHLAGFKGAAIPTDGSWMVSHCAGKLDADNPEQSALRQQAQRAVQDRMQRHTAALPAAASVDDGSDALALYAKLLRDDGKLDEARATTERQIALLEAAAAAAPDPPTAATFDYQRMNAYLALGRGDAAVAMLRQRMAELPDAYEPAARLAQALIQLKRYAEAGSPLKHAIAKAYGPRQLRYLNMAVQLAHVQKDDEAERVALRALLAAFAELPNVRLRAHERKMRQAAEDRLVELDAADPKPQP